MSIRCVNTPRSAYWDYEKMKNTILAVMKRGMRSMSIGMTESGGSPEIAVKPAGRGASNGDSAAI